MKRIALVLTLLLAAFAFAAVGQADDGGKGNKNKNDNGSFKLGPFLVHVTDNGSCGTEWANDTIKRTYYVKKTGTGTYRVIERDKGTFVTNAGGLVNSPGACNNGTNNGRKVTPGVTGKMKGYITGTATGTFNKNATCAAECTSDVFFPAFFGPANTFSCFENSTDCKFDFKYRANDQNLKGRSWRDRGTGAGTQLNERFSGDIYNLP
jgi:hypothetical protein